MNDWIAPLLAQLAQGRPVVRLALASVRGSAPREPGATMLCWTDAGGRPASHGTIGGGHLEARAMQIAAELLSGAVPGRRMERFTLAATLGQCCGGVVELYWERFDRLADARVLADADLAAGALRLCALDGSGRDRRLDASGPAGAALRARLGDADAACLVVDGVPSFVEWLADERTELWLYGAGHVGRALVGVLAGLPFRLTWIDSRPQTLAEAVAACPGRELRALPVEPPVDAVADAPAGAWHLVMTHSHDQDFDLCERLLRDARFGFLGVIGSRSKAARFRQRLARRGLADETIARMACPIGLATIGSKWPAAIAVSVAARLLELREAAARPLAASRRTPA